MHETTRSPRENLDPPGLADLGVGHDSKGSSMVVSLGVAIVADRHTSYCTSYSTVQYIHCTKLLRTVHAYSTRAMWFYCMYRIRCRLARYDTYAHISTT